MPDAATTTTLTTADPPRPLPDGWRWARLGDVCELNPRRPEIIRHDSALTSFIPMAAVAERWRQCHCC